jgi:predicted membrane protein
VRYLSGRLFIGLFLLLLGVAIILNLLGFDISVRDIFTYWPLLLVILGLDLLISSFRSRTVAGERKTVFSPGSFLCGLIIFFIGVLYLARKFGYLTELKTGVIWSILLAALLIIAGINLIRGLALAERSGGRWAFLGGVKVGGSSPWKLESGSYFAFMGGIDMDLTAAEIPDGETFLDLTAIMGGIDVKIPPGLAVVYEGTAILGGITFKDQEDGGIVSSRKISEPGAAPDGKYLRIQARAYMGGIEIKEK